MLLSSSCVVSVTAMCVEGVCVCLSRLVLLLCVVCGFMCGLVRFRFVCSLGWVAQVLWGVLICDVGLWGPGWVRCPTFLVLGCGAVPFLFFRGPCVFVLRALSWCYPVSPFLSCRCDVISLPWSRPV